MKLGKIKVGNKEVEVACSAATPIKFKLLSGLDLLDFFVKYFAVEIPEGATEQEKVRLYAEAGTTTSQMETYCAYLLYIMAVDASGLSGRAKVPTQDGFIKFLEGFNSLDITNAIDTILEFWSDTEEETAQAKKDTAEPTDPSQQNSTL